jgi:signal transduction histidine kinase
MQLQRTDVEVKKLLEDIAAQLNPLSSDAQIKVDVVANSDLPHLSVDIEKIGRVFSNLLDNAIKFTPNGGHIRLWARCEPRHCPSDILIGVTDSGPGIPVEVQDRLFKKFQRISSIEGRRVGTGLGLFYCKLAVEAHGGEIWVESQEGQGSSFITRLPLA